MTEGRFVREAREKSGLTQMELSKKLGWGNPQFISNIERAKSNLPPIHFKKFIKITKCDPDTFFKIKMDDYCRELQRWF